MKNIFQLAIFITLINLVVSSCKKGANDPSISLLSRKARVVGDWHIRSGTSSYMSTNVHGATYSERFTFDDDGYDYAMTDETGTSGFAKGNHSLTMKFEKDGKVKIYESFDNLSQTITGTWNFNGSIGSAKSKEQIIIHATYIAQFIGSSKISGNQTSVTYTLTELRNKKMALYSEYKSTNSDNSALNYTDSYIMEQ